MTAHFLVRNRPGEKCRPDRKAQGQQYLGQTTVDTEVPGSRAAMGLIDVPLRQLPCEVMRINVDRALRPLSQEIFRQRKPIG